MRVVCVHRKPNECIVFGNVCVVLVTPDCDMTCTLDQIYVESGVKKKGALSITGNCPVSDMCVYSQSFTNQHYATHVGLNKQ